MDDDGSAWGSALASGSWPDCDHTSGDNTAQAAQAIDCSNISGGYVADMLVRVQRPLALQARLVGSLLPSVSEHRVDA